MGDTNDIKRGAVIRHQGNLYVVTSFNFVNPGKGAAFTKTKMKSITTGKTIEVTYKSSETVETASVQNTNMQFLYGGNGSMYSFMIRDTYETIELAEDVLGDDAKYLKEGLDVIGLMHDGNIIAVQIPKKVKYVVKNAPPAVKGDSTSGNVTKDVELENGLVIQAPIFIKDGEVLLVNTETGQYDSRVTE